MKKRPYRLGRREEAAEETRRRIVAATFALHNEQGVVATSMKQIAERAEVSVGTVYHHFPTYGDAVNACGQHAMAYAPLPTPAALDGADTTAERIGRTTAAVFAFYERLPAFARVRCDRDKVPELEPFMAGEEANRVALVQAALRGTGAGRAQTAAAVAVLDVAVYQALRRAGLSAGAATDAIAHMILASLATAGARTEDNQPERPAVGAGGGL
ncbi:MAG: TetR/AcrR family transcriptional regulator [Alphaproteobacteria bacterium]